MTRFGLSTTIFGDTPPGAREIDLIAEHGFALVELDAGAGRFDVRDPARVAVVGAAVASAGLDIAGVSVPLGEASLAVPALVDLGCPLLVARAGGCAAHGRPSPPMVSDAGALRRAIEHVAEHATGRGITLAVEFPAALRAGRHGRAGGIAR